MSQYEKARNLRTRTLEALTECDLISFYDQTINLCEVKFTKESFATTKKYVAQLRMKKAIFKQATKIKKASFNTLLTIYPALKNKYYLEEIDNVISMDMLRSGINL